MNKNIVKYPKNLALAETSTKRYQLVLDDRVKNMDKTAFELSGAFPYIFDALNYICTHCKAGIERINDITETHYRVRLPMHLFYDFALDKNMKYKKALLRELYKIIEKPPTKYLPLTKQESVLTAPIKIDLFYDDTTKIKNQNLKNLKAEGKEIKYIALEFYKPLWNRIFKGKYGEAWFYLPKAFHVKMLSTIEKYRDTKEFKRYGNLAKSTNYRALTLFINLHDNQKGVNLTLDAVNLAMSCLPGNTYERNYKVFLKNWYVLHQFIQKGIRLLHKMGEDGLMNGTNLIPTSVWYNKPMQEVKIGIHRNKIISEDKKGLPLFTDKTKFQGNKWYDKNYVENNK